MSEPTDETPAPRPSPPSPRHLPPPPPPLRRLPPPPPAILSESGEESGAARPTRTERKAKRKTARVQHKADSKVAKGQRKADRKAAQGQRKADRKTAKLERKLAPKPPREPIRPIYQARLLLQAAHPVQALVMAIVIVVIAASDHRGVGGTLVAGLGVLLTQLALGLLNDVYDAPSDARGERARKPVASGALPRGNATYLAVVLVLASLPVAALNGTVAGAALILTLPVGFLHNRILHRTPLSFVGWMVTFPLLATYLAYGGWGGGKHGAMPPWQVLVASAALGLTCHFLTALPDLVADHKAGLAELPLVIARRTGATILLIITVVCLVAAVAATAWCALHFGLRQR